MRCILPIIISCMLPYALKSLGGSKSDAAGADILMAREWVVMDAATACLSVWIGKSCISFACHAMISCCLPSSEVMVTLFLAQGWPSTVSLPIGVTSIFGSFCSGLAVDCIAAGLISQ